VGLDLPHLAEGGLDGFFGGNGPVESRMNLSLLVRAKSGRTVALNAVAFPLGPSAGELLGWLIVGRHMKGTLSETRGVPSVVGALVDSIGAALWAFDPGGAIVAWSQACEVYFGYPRDEAEERLRAVRLFASPAEFRRVTEIVVRDGRFSGELGLVMRDGTMRPNHVTVTRFEAGDGTVIGYTCVSFDVTERRRLEEIQRALFDQVAEAIVVSDPVTKRLLDANEMACRLHGYPREEFLQLSVRDLLPEDYDPGHLATVYRQLDETSRFYGEQERHRRKDGSVFPCSLNVRRISVGG
jgi:PAS domain S-box-containing protein